MFITGFCASSIVTTMFLFANSDNSVTCHGRAHFVEQSEICVIQAFCLVFCFAWVVSWSVIFSLDVYYQVVSLSLSYDSSQYHLQYTLAAALVSLTMAVIPFAAGNLGFDPEANIPICFYLISHNENFFWYTFFAPMGIMIAACTVITIVGLYKIQRIYTNSRVYDDFIRQQRHQDRDNYIEKLPYQPPAATSVPGLGVGGLHHQYHPQQQHHQPHHQLHHQPHHHQHLSQHYHHQQPFAPIRATIYDHDEEDEDEDGHPTPNPNPAPFHHDLEYDDIKWSTPRNKNNNRSIVGAIGHNPLINPSGNIGQVSSSSSSSSSSVHGSSGKDGSGAAVIESKKKNDNISSSYLSNNNASSISGRESTSSVTSNASTVIGITCVSQSQSPAKGLRGEGPVTQLYNPISKVLAAGATTDGTDADDIRRSFRSDDFGSDGEQESCEDANAGCDDDDDDELSLASTSTAASGISERWSRVLSEEQGQALARGLEQGSLIDGHSPIRHGGGHVDRSLGRRQAEPPSKAQPRHWTVWLWSLYRSNNGYKSLNTDQNDTDATDRNYSDSHSGTGGTTTTSEHMDFIERHSDLSELSESALSVTAATLFMTWQRNWRSIIFVTIFCLTGIYMLVALYYIYGKNHARQVAEVEAYIECLVVAAAECTTLPITQDGTDECAEIACGTHPDPRPNTPFVRSFSTFLSCAVALYCVGSRCAGLIAISR